MASRQEGAARPHHDDRLPDDRSRLGRVEPMDPCWRAGAPNADRGASDRAYHPARDQGGWNHGRPVRDQSADQSADRPETLNARILASSNLGLWPVQPIEGTFAMQP